MATLDSTSGSDKNGVLFTKPKAGVYTALLAISLVAICLAIFLLWQTLGTMYDFQYNGPTAT